jgi:signal transduction histidine kinase/CheY-like chemotaxis protein/HPt (histidine-containing phosphotransfer) domain-containing protein
MKDIFAGAPFSTESESAVGFTVSRRITANDGRFAGVVVMGVRLAAVRELLNRHELGTSEAVTLMRDDGTVLMRLPFDLKDIGHRIEPFAPFLAFSRSGQSSISTRVTSDDAAQRLVFRRVGGYPLVVGVATLPEEDGRGWPYLPWAVGGAATVGIGCWLLVRRLWREQRLREAAERQSEEKSRFLAMLSHELRTPLHGVLGYADQLSRDRALSLGQTRHVAEIVRSARHMRDVVNVVLDYARVEAPGPAVHMRRFDVRQLVEDCLAVVEPSAKARGLATRCTAAAALPAQFVTDELQLRQILVNLLSNAVKYTPSGGIDVHLSGDEDHLTIEVADTGIGIPESQRHLLFKEFERFGTERTSIEGTGLGLAIAHRLVRRLGGHIGHRDNPGGGSVFWLELPAGAADEPAAAPAQEIVPDRRLDVLVADDSDVNRAVAATFLRQAGHAVIEAHDGSEAVRHAAARDFDVVLMDMRMAGMDGLEATRRIRALEGPRGRVPIVAVTANALDQHAEECRRAGMSDHLAKPFTQAELLAVIARAAPAQVAPEPTIDPDSMAQLTGCMGADAVERMMDGLALRIEALLRKVEDPAAGGSMDQLGDLAHELAGSGGTLGCTRLAAAARRFEAAIATDTADAAELRREATSVLAEMRRRRSLGALCGPPPIGPARRRVAGVPGDAPI